MKSLNFVQHGIYFFVFVILQIPVIYKLILFDKAFIFFYIGFILLLPYGLSRSFAMIAAFFCGLIVDIFSSTPGIHAAACVFIAFIKDYWLNLSHDVPDDDFNLNFGVLGLWGFIKYAFPLTLFHHLIIFIVENGGLSAGNILFGKVIYSSIFSFLFILVFSIILTPKRTRV